MKYLSKNQKYIPGIYGGVGPLSHIYFEQQLIKISHDRGAKEDQDYLVYFLFNASSTPDRTKNLLYKGESPINHMFYFAKKIEKSGADFMVVICNTAHAFYNEISRKIKIPWINMIEVVAKEIKNKYPLVKKVGIIGTDGTINARIYHKSLESKGINVISPKIGSLTQQKVMNAIYHPTYGIKSSGNSISKFSEQNVIDAILELKNNDAELIITACTEVSLCVNYINSQNSLLKDFIIIDPLVIMAEVVFNLSYGKINFKDFM